MLNELAKVSHKNAVDKGFYDNEILTIESLKKLKENNLTDEDTDKLINANFVNTVISSKLMLIVSELGEALEALRNRNLCKIERIPNTVETDTDMFLQFVKDTFEDEIADVFIRLFDLCGFMEIDIERHIKLKMDYNKSRPKLHGKEF